MGGTTAPKIFPYPGAVGQPDGANVVQGGTAAPQSSTMMGSSVNPVATPAYKPAARPPAPPAPRLPVPFKPKTPGANANPFRPQFQNQRFGGRRWDMGGRGMYGDF